MTQILNLTQHAATPDQMAAGVVDLPAAKRARLQAMLTVDAKALADSSENCGSAFLGMKAQSIVTEFVIPYQVAAAEKLLSDEWKTKAPLKGVDALNAMRDATRVHVMIGGMPALMRVLELALHNVGAVPHDALSNRVSVDGPVVDGKASKVSVFQHVGFWPPVE